MKSMFWRVLSLASLIAMASHAADDAPPSDAPLFDPIFQDHAVLQQDVPIKVWGSAPHGDRVSVTIGTSSAEARADDTGHWRTELPILKSGGPFTLTARTQSGAKQVLSDILVGDVWLCSGQSNMELPVSGSLNSAYEISVSANERLRLVTVPHANPPSPQSHLQTAASWAAARPDNVRDFSAACFYFARELQKTHPGPIGLIQAAWGGSRIEPWISDAGLRQEKGFDEPLDLLRHFASDQVKGNELFASLWQRWWQSQTNTNSKPWADRNPGNWHAQPMPMRDWKTWGVPELANHDGMVWFRRSVKLSEAQAAGPSSLSLGKIDEIDVTWVNGVAIGNSFGYGTERTYAVPAGLLHAGENLIVVNVLSTWDAGGMYGPVDHMSLHAHDGSSVALGGDWQYQYVPDAVGLPPRAPWVSVSGLSTLYNGMIAPIQPYSLRGILWYQGESNAGEAKDYQRLLTRLMADWRTGFGAETPFLIVQLPDFGARNSAPVESAWANLREAQRRAVASDPRAALVVSIDVGEPRELHPPNKQAIGERLARAARSLVYREPITASGPRPRRIEHVGANIVVAFTDVDGSLLTYSADRPVGFELCDKDSRHCHFAEASHDSAQVTIAAALPTDERLRYCWGDAPICNLYDRSGLPAGPFDLPIQ